MMEKRCVFGDGWGEDARLKMKVRSINRRVHTGDPTSTYVRRCRDSHRRVEPGEKTIRERVLGGRRY